MEDNMYKQKEIPLVIIFSLLSCGIYMIYWIYVTSRDINEYLEISDMDPALEVFLCFCWPYFLYWLYKYSGRIVDAQIKAGLQTSEDNSILCLILGIIGFGYVSAGVMQGSLNKVWVVRQNEGF